MTLRVEICGGGNAQAALQCASQVGQDVSKQIRCHDHVKLGRITYEGSGKRIHMKLPYLDIRIVTGNGSNNLIPHDKSILLRVRLGRTGKPFRTLARQFESVAGYT